MRSWVGETEACVHGEGRVRRMRLMGRIKKGIKGIQWTPGDGMGSLGRSKRICMSDRRQEE